MRGQRLEEARGGVTLRMCVIETWWTALAMMCCVAEWTISRQAQPTVVFTEAMWLCR